MKNRKKLLTALDKSNSNLSKRADQVKTSKRADQVKTTKIDKNKSKLAGAKFRWINEKLYTISSQDALQLFKCNPDMFTNYHDGFDTQVKNWPQNPVDIFINRLRAKGKNTVIADMGCGTAKMAKILSNEMTVHSFDLAAANNFVTITDIAHVPLKDQSADVVVFSLSLMGVNYIDFLIEAHRILKNGGELMIGEVTSRFIDLNRFVLTLKNMGFKLESMDDSNKMFVLFYLKKINDPVSIDQTSLLKPCIYKKR